MGTFFTAASFLKLGAAAYFDKARGNIKDVKEAPISMLLPAIVIAAGCLVFVVRQWGPLTNLIHRVLGDKLEEQNVATMAMNPKLVLITVVVLVFAVLNHIFAAKIKGSGLKAADYIYEAPVLHSIYDKAKNRYFDPYDRGLSAAGFLARVGWLCDRGVDWVYNKFAVGLAGFFTQRLKKAHSGNYAVYLGWSIVGMAVVAVAVDRDR